MDYKIKISYAVLLITSLLLISTAFALQAYAQGTYSCEYTTDGQCVLNQNNCEDGYLIGVCSGSSATECTSSGGECLSGPPLASKVSNLYNIALGVGVVLALGILVYAGVRYSASGGNPSAISDAKSWIWAAIFGLLLLFGSYVILKFINPALTDLKDPTTLQNATSPSVQVGFTLQGSGGLLESSRNVVATVVEECLNSGNSKDICLQKCIDKLVASELWNDDIATRAFCDEIVDEIAGSVLPVCKASGERCLSPGVQSNCCADLTCERESGSTYICRSGTDGTAGSGTESGKFKPSEYDSIFMACGTTYGLSGDTAGWKANNLIKLISSTIGGKEQLECISNLGTADPGFDKVDNFCRACESNGGDLSGCYNGYNGSPFRILCTKE